MEFKVFLLCFAVLVVATSAAKVCKCVEEEEETKRGLEKTVSKYKIRIKDGDKEVDEELEVDTEKQTEKLHVPKTDSSTAGEVDIVYDFKKNLTMQRLSAAKACFLSEGTENIAKPDDLVKALDQPSTEIASNDSSSSYEVVSTVTDRSDLSDDMASLCAKVPIYRIKKIKILSGRVKRHPYCHWHCYWYTTWCYHPSCWCCRCRKEKCTWYCHY